MYNIVLNLYFYLYPQLYPPNVLVGKLRVVIRLMFYL